MSTWRQRRKVAQATRLLDGINEMKIGGDMTDFIVKVGTTSFNVHRLVLAVSSPYFRAMLSHNMKEANKGEVLMQGLSVKAVGACIQFMYAGEVDFKIAEIADVLYAASFMQLDHLIEACSDFLDENIGIDTVIRIQELARVYDFEELVGKTKNFIQCNLAETSSTASFLDLSADDVAECTTNPDINKEVAWTATMAWIRFDKEGRSKYLPTLLRLFFDSNDNLEGVILSTWANEEVQKSTECQTILQERLMKLTPDEIILINKDICCQVKSILRNCEIGDTFIINEAMNKLLVNNFDEVSTKEEFTCLSFADLVQALQEFKGSDIVKWTAILHWTKHDKRRKKRFLELLKLLDLSAFTVDFIQDNVRQESLVKESTEAMMLLLDALALKVRTTNTNDASDSEQQQGFSLQQAKVEIAEKPDVVEVLENVNLENACGSEEAVAEDSKNAFFQAFDKIFMTAEESHYNDVSDPEELDEDIVVHHTLLDSGVPSQGTHYPHEIEQETFGDRPRRSSSNYPHHPPPFHPHRPPFHSRPRHPPPPPPHEGLHHIRHRHPPPPPPHHPRLHHPFHRGRLSRRRGHPS